LSHHTTTLKGHGYSNAEENMMVWFDRESYNELRDTITGILARLRSGPKPDRIPKERGNKQKEPKE
jgi:deoxyxylulose-5-phosphate synthase